MAKRRSRKGGLKVARFDAQVALSTLGAATIILGDMLGTINNEHYAISMDAYVSVQDHTAAEGPLDVGVAHGDYTTTEVGEWFNSTNLIGGTDQVQKEHNRRKCRDIGRLSGLSTQEILFDGGAKRVRLGFMVEDGATMNIFVFNRDDDALTTGTTVLVSGKYYYRLK